MGFTQEGYIELPEGKTWWGIVGKKTTRPPLLVIHGGPGYPSDYLWTLAALADDRQVIFYDQLGCGRSDRITDPAYWIIENFVEELSILRRKLDLDSVHLFGHSWGTMILTDYLLTYPSGVRSAIFASSAISNPMWLADCSRYLDALPNGGGRIIRMHEASGDLTAPEYIEAVRIYRRIHELRLDTEPTYLSASNDGMNLEQYYYMCGPSEYNSTGSMKDYDRTEHLHKIRVPALFTCGRYDGSSPETNAYYASQIDGAQVRVFEESSHLPHLEEPKNYVGEVRKFLASLD
jgi:proline iminopeptidase